MPRFIKVLLYSVLLIGISGIVGDIAYERGFSQGRKFAGWEFYEDVAKRALSGKVIYGTVIIEGPNSVLSDSLIIAGGDGVVIGGDSSTIIGCTMLVTELGGFAITNDPNEAEELRMEG